jgi:hypothetical protein
LNNHLPGYFLFTSEVTGGGTANLVLLHAEDAELGIAMTSSLFESQQGVLGWTGGQPLGNLRSVLALYPSWLTVYTLADSGIYSMQDLSGRIVGLGSVGMAMDPIFREFFASHGITPSQIHNDGHAATATALGNRVVDAAILFSYPPFAAINELETTRDLRFIALSEEEVQYFVDRYDFYQPDALPAGSYRGNPYDVRGVSEWNMLVSNSNVSADYVYLMVKTLLENQQDLITVHPSARHMLAENVINSNIFLHAGTVRYLKEIGIDVPAELIPPEFER